MIFDWLSKRRRRGAPTSSAESTATGKRQPFVKRSWLHTSLQFTQTEAQSRMWTFRPQALLVGYTRSMMGFVRFVGAPERIAMIGLGGGSLAKYCFRHLPSAAIDVVEINPQVIALRDTFRVPKDDARFRVHLDDGALFLRRHRRRYDVLLVDGYDETGIPAALAAQRFYNDCHAALVEGGVLVVNLFCADADRHLQRIRKRFGAAMVSVPQPNSTNQVVFAWVPGPTRKQVDNALSEQAQADLAAELERLDAALAGRRGRRSEG